MKRINNMDLLENTDQNIIDRIAEEYPPSDEDEKEKIFRMTMEKYNSKKSADGYEDTEVTVSGVEHYRKFSWVRITSAAAACLAIIAGTAATLHMNLADKGEPDIPQPHQVATAVTNTLTTEPASSGNTDSENAVSAAYEVPFGKMTDYEYTVSSGDLPKEKEHTEDPHLMIYSTSGETAFMFWDMDNKLSADKRASLDALFSQQQWEELPSDKMVSDGTDDNHILYRFTARTDNTLRIIWIRDDNSLFFNEIALTEKDGKFFTDADFNKGKNYKIDSAKYKAAIDAILKGESVPAPTEANTEPTTEPASSAAADTTEAPEPQPSDTEHTVTVDTYSWQTHAPFGNFKDCDYRFASAKEGSPIANAANTLTEPDHNTRIVLELGDSTEYREFAWDTPLSDEQKKTISDIFNNYTWNTTTQPNMEEVSNDTDFFSMMYMEDSFIYEITFIENNIMRYDLYVTHGIVGNDDYLARKVSTYYYSIDYAYFRDAIAQAVVSPYQFHEQNVYFTLNSDGTNRSYDIVCVYNRGDKVSEERAEPFIAFEGVTANYGIGIQFVKNIPDVQTAQLCIINKSTQIRAVMGEYTYDPNTDSVTTVFEDPQAAYSAVQ